MVMGGGWVLRVEGEALEERNEKTNRVGGGKKRARRGFQTRERGKEEGRKSEGKKGGLSLASTTGWLQVIHSAIIVRC